MNCRAGGGDMRSGLVVDLRLAVRAFRGAPVVTAAALLTLSLGIGATTAIFSVADGMILRPLPFRNPRELVTISSQTALRFGFQAGGGWGHAMWDRLRQRGGEFGGGFAWTLQRLDLSDGGEMQPATVLVASGDVFRTLGVTALAGRAFTVADDVAGGGPDGPVAVISEKLWRRRFDGRNVLGSHLLVDRAPVTIVGVMPAWFSGVDVGQPFDVAMPFGTEAFVHGKRSLMNSGTALLLTVMLRLKPAQTVPEATAALHAMQPFIVGANAPRFLKEPFVIVGASRGISDRSGLRQRYERPLVILSIVSGLVLVIVCLNIANLQLSRAAARRPETSVRTALGAPRWRLARPHLVEAVMLGSAGTAGGVLVGAWTSRILVAQLPWPDGHVSIDLTIDWRVLAFSAALASIAVGCFGIVPAAYATSVPAMEALRDAGRGTSGGRSGRLSSGLVVAQVALSIVLLAVAGLFVTTAKRLVSAPLGFDPHGVLVISVMPRPLSGSPDARPLDRRLLEAVASVPGVTQAAGSVWTPIGSRGGGLLSDAAGRRVDFAPPAAFNFVTPGWFDTYRTPVRAGRDFDARDDAGAAKVAVINEALSRRFIVDGQALGRTIRSGPCERDGCTVVGVVADAVYGRTLRDTAPPTIYVPLSQSAGLAPPDAPLQISLRAGDPAAVMPPLAARLRGVDPGLAFTFTRLEQTLEASVAQERLLATLAGFFGAIALLLCGVGLYGVSACEATRRRAEIGIRLALGGRPHAVLGGMLGRLGLLVAAGTIVGLLGAVWLSRFVAPLLYGLPPRDPVTFAESALALAAAAAVAGWIPASRATRLDPAQVLREH
jgi:putative ABC transport system permease protein